MTAFISKQLAGAILDEAGVASEIQEQYFALQNLVARVYTTALVSEHRARGEAVGRPLTLVTMDERDEIHRLWNSGMSAGDIAQRPEFAHLAPRQIYPQVLRHQPSGVAVQRQTQRPVLQRPDVVERMQDLAREGRTAQGIADQLNHEGIPTYRSNKRWSSAGVRGTLRKAGTPLSAMRDGRTCVHCGRHFPHMLRSHTQMCATFQLVALMREWQFSHAEIMTTLNALGRGDHRGQPWQTAKQLKEWYHSRAREILPQ